MKFKYKEHYILIREYTEWFKIRVNAKQEFYCGLEFLVWKNPKTRKWRAYEWRTGLPMSKEYDKRSDAMDDCPLYCDKMIAWINSNPKRYQKVLELSSKLNIKENSNDKN